MKPYELTLMALAGIIGIGTYIYKFRCFESKDDEDSTSNLTSSTSSTDEIFKRLPESVTMER